MEKSTRGREGTSGEADSRKAPTRRIHRLAAGLLPVGLLGVMASGCSGQATPTPVSVGAHLLPLAGSPPVGVKSTTVNPIGLGVSFSVPAGWINEGPTASGFEDSYRNPTQPDLFVLTATQPAVATTASAIASDRSDQFKRLDATTTMDSIETGTVDGLPAARFQYEITIPNHRTARDVEYDVLVGSTIALVVIGTSPTHPDTQLVDWVASTIRA